MNAPQVIGYDDEGREFVEPVVPIVTTPGAAPVPPGGAPVPPTQPPTGQIPQPPRPAEPTAPLPQPPQPAAPEQFIVAARAADPFASATATVYSDGDSDLGETFGSRRARRDFERQRELEVGPVEVAPEPPYAGLVTAPVMLQREPGAPMPPVPGGAPIPPMPAGAPIPPQPAAPTPMPPVPVAPATGAYTAGVPVPGYQAAAGYESVVAQATLSPRPATAHANAGGFAIESTEISESVPPERKLIAKPAYSGASYLLAFSGVFPAGIIALLVVVLGLGGDQTLIWAVWVAAWFAGILLAFYDRLKLRSWGHANTASPLLAIFTPIIYLVARNAATTGETGQGRRVIVYWIIGLVLMAGIVYLVPQVMEATIPGFIATWTSPLKA